MFPDWNEAEILRDFHYPWLPEVCPDITFRALWNKNAFYFRFDVIAENVLVFHQSTDKMEVIDSDRVELFLRSDQQMVPYYCLEMDPLGRILDYRATYYRQFEYNWHWPEAKHLHIESNYTTNGYVVEGSITLNSLRNLLLLKNNTLQAGLFRGECLKSNSANSNFRWISWVHPDSVKPDFHIPTAFGELKLQH